MTGSRKVKFSAVGDIALGDHPMCIGFGTYSRHCQSGGEELFQNVSQLLSESDIVFGNLECALASDVKNRKSYSDYQMRGSPAFAASMKFAGFNILNVANNHSQQHGRESFLKTIGILEAHGINACGSRLESETVQRAKVLLKEGLKVGFLGYSMLPRQYFCSTPYFWEGNLIDPLRVIEDIKNNRSDLDILILSLHWGEEFVQVPSPDEIKAARQFIDAGADIIVGHHPHVLRGVEYYNGGVIAYSLGNFVGDMSWSRELVETAIFSCTLSENGISDTVMMPAIIGRNYAPYLLEGKERNNMERNIYDLSEAVVKNAYNVDRDSYRAEAAKRNAALILKSRLYFFMNIYRYPFFLLAGKIWSYFSVRLKNMFK